MIRLNGMDVFAFLPPGEVILLYDRYQTAGVQTILVITLYTGSIIVGSCIADDMVHDEYRLQFLAARVHELVHTHIENCEGSFGPAIFGEWCETALARRGEGGAMRRVTGERGEIKMLSVTPTLSLGQGISARFAPVSFGTRPRSPPGSRTRPRSAAGLHG
jgi:hypothetical protein